MLFQREPDPQFDQRHQWTFTIAEAWELSTDALFVQTRALANYWWALYPEGDDKGDLARRLRSPDNNQFVHAFLELMSFAALHAAGLSPMPHPVLPSGRRADFGLVLPDETPAYAECHVMTPAQELVAAARREDDFLGRVHSLDLPGWTLTVNILTHGQRQPRFRDFETWLRAHLERARGDEGEWTWNFEDWSIRIAAMRLPTSGGGIIGMQVSGAASTRSKIRAALRAKSGYRPEAPFLLILSATGIHPFDDDLVDALVGDPQWSINLDTKNVSVDRIKNGAWTGRDGKLRSSSISAILFTPNLHPRSLDASRWQLVHAPKPTHPFPQGLIPFAKEISWEGGAAEVREPAVTLEDFVRPPDTP